MKRLENLFTVLALNARAFVGHRNRAGFFHRDRDGAAATAVGDGVLNEIDQRPFQRRLIAQHDDGLRVRGKRHLVTGCDCQRRKVGRHPPRKFDQIQPLHLVRMQIETLQIQQLLGQGRQTRDVLQQPAFVGPVGERFDAGLNDCDRRSQLVRGIGQKTLVPFVAMVEAAQRAVERVDQRSDFSGDILQRDPRPAPIDINALGLRRRVAETCECAANHRRRRKQGRQRHQQKDRQSDHRKDQQGRQRGFARWHHPLCRGEDLDAPGRRIDPLETGREPLRIITDLPAQPPLVDVVEGMPDAREIRWHGALGQHLALRIRHDKPQIRHLGA